jgi:hypothetical protein
MLYSIFTLILLNEAFPMISRVTQTGIVCKIYTLDKLTYQLITSRLTKQFVFHFIGSLYLHYFGPHHEFSNGHSITSNKDCIQKSRPREVDVWTYHFVVDKIIVISSCRVMFRVHRSERNGVVNFNYHSS